MLRQPDVDARRTVVDDQPPGIAMPLKPQSDASSRWRVAQAAFDQRGEQLFDPRAIPFHQHCRRGQLAGFHRYRLRLRAAAIGPDRIVDQRDGIDRGEGDRKTPEIGQGDGVEILRHLLQALHAFCDLGKLALLVRHLVV
ncbi:hypothetical protein D9M73_169410 [compost metagenome]